MLECNCLQERRKRLDALATSVAHSFLHAYAYVCVALYVCFSVRIHSSPTQAMIVQNATGGS